MPDTIEDVIAALPEANRVAITEAVATLKEGLESDIATLKGTHGETVGKLNEQVKGFEVQVASLRSNGDADVASGSKFETADQVRTRHQKEADDAVRAREIASKDAEIAALKGGNFQSDLKAAKAEGLTDEQLALATTPELLAMMRAMNPGKGRTTIPQGGSGLSGSQGAVGNTNQSTTPNKQEAGLRSLEAAGNPFSHVQ